MSANGDSLLESVQKVEGKYKSVKNAPDSAMHDIWVKSGAVHPEKRTPVLVSQRVYTLIKVSVGHDVKAGAVAGLLGRTTRYATKLITAYRANRLEVSEGSVNHE